MGGSPRRNAPERGAPASPRLARGTRRPGFDCGLWLVVALGLLLLVRVGSAGETDLHGVTGFDEYSENHVNIGRALSQRPSLALDPTYLKHHPSLDQFLKDNPLSKAELESKGEEDDTQDDEIDPSAGRHADTEHRLGRFPHKGDTSGSGEPQPRHINTSNDGDD
jgi:hypothetical protein